MWRSNFCVQISTIGKCLYCTKVIDVVTYIVIILNYWFLITGLAFGFGGFQHFVVVPPLTISGLHTTIEIGIQDKTD